MPSLNAPAGNRGRCGRRSRPRRCRVAAAAFAYALYVHSKFPGYGAAWSAWIADVAVSKATGDVSVTRVAAGQDSGLMINPDGVRHQIHGNVIQSTSRALMEEVSFDRTSVTAREWGAYPIISSPSAHTSTS
jgi:nicotinate dehydrogenase subunit B